MRKISSFSTQVSIFLFFVVIFVISSIFNRIDLACLVSFDSGKIRSQIIEAFDKGGDDDESIRTTTAEDQCPEHFRWIHEDLKPWKNVGITKNMVERGTQNKLSHFKLIIFKGKPYIEHYSDCFETREPFSLWGILQLLRLYPNKIPDLELLFACDDQTVVKKSTFLDNNNIPPPPVFHYCGDSDSYDIVFPDWSFWGWAETNIRAWDRISKSIEENSLKRKWKDREPFAFWKGNTMVATVRYDLTQCNANDQNHWKAHIHSMKWDKAAKRGLYNHTKLENQCDHRYKIYVEGRSWSVSEKYILACDSMALFIEPKYYDFFSRSLVPLRHYWPISIQNMCQDINFAVEWGNSNAQKAEEIGKEGSKFIRENLRMELVYDYMLHVLQQYAKLLRYEVTIPEGAVELSLDSVTTMVNKRAMRFLEDSRVEKAATDRPPCKMPPPFEPQQINVLHNTKQSLIKQVAMEANQYWQTQPS